MRNKTKITLIAFLSSATILLFSFLYLINGSGYQLINTENSPNSIYTLTEFLSNSEAGHAPYGSYLVLSTEPIANPDKGHIIYAGYCFKLNYTWDSNEQITINCKSKESIKTITLAKVSYGININFNTNS
ncbi:MAG TPA: hypothetical protein VIQ81_06695 [Gammaproteobacteria bacterium]